MSELSDLNMQLSQECRSIAYSLYKSCDKNSNSTIRIADMTDVLYLYTKANDIYKKLMCLFDQQNEITKFETSAIKSYYGVVAFNSLPRLFHNVMDTCDTYKVKKHIDRYINNEHYGYVPDNIETVEPLSIAVADDSGKSSEIKIS